MVLERLGQIRNRRQGHRDRGKADITFPSIPSKAILGDCRVVLGEFPPNSVQLVFTSPPYFNAKPECAEYIDYSSYLSFLGEAFAACHSVLAEGRFLIVNVSPVLVRRTSRSTASKRLPIPFDLHPILDRVGFEFIDDIIWRKPEGAGWHLGRGRRFAADRQPLQYKPVTVTEYVLVYRKKTDRLIDWNLRNHPDPMAVGRSLILGEYDKTNAWDITPSNHKAHPAVFPDELVSRIIRYYSFEGDNVLDPFAGTGTVGRVAAAMGRRYLCIEKRADYYDTMRQELRQSDFCGTADLDDLQYAWSADYDAEPLRP
jgi:DNA modification methylase